MSAEFTAYAGLTGQVLFSGTASDTDVLASAKVAVLVGKKFEGGWIDNGVHHGLPSQPTPEHTFNWVTKQWEDPRTLQDFKEAQWATIKQSRTNAEYAGFTWDGSTLDSDAISQNRITGAVTLAQMSPDFTIGWVLADNSVRTLSQMDMLQVGGALGQHVAVIFAKAAGLRAQIEAATTREAVEAVVW